MAWAWRSAAALSNATAAGSTWNRKLGEERPSPSRCRSQHGGSRYVEPAMAGAATKRGDSSEHTRKTTDRGRRTQRARFAGKMVSRRRLRSAHRRKCQRRADATGRTTWDAALVDIKMHGTDGIELQRRMHEIDPESDRDHDDRLRFGRNRGHGAEEWRLRLCHQAARSR